MLLENESFPDDTRVLMEAESLDHAGFDVTVICPTGESSRKLDRVGRIRVYRYPKPLEMGGFIGYVTEYVYSMFMALVYSLWILVRHGFDAVHVHVPPDMNALVAIFYKCLGKRFVLDMHDLSPELYQAQRGGDGNRLVFRTLLWFERLACRWADRLISTNETQRVVQTNRCGAKSDHCYVVRNGPNETFLKPTEPCAELIKPNRTVIGYVGVIGVQDGVDFFLRALSELRTVRKRENFLAVVVGSGPAFNGLRELAKELALDDYVHFTGMITFSLVPSHIAAFDICVTPDPSNPYNDSCTTIKTLEYMALGKPTVCFRTVENQYTAGDAALYAENNDVSEFAAAIERLMDNPELRRTMGANGRKRVENGFTWRQQERQLIDLYRQLFGLPSLNTRSMANAVG